MIHSELLYLKTTKVYSQSLTNDNVKVKVEKGSSIRLFLAKAHSQLTWGSRERFLFIVLRLREFEAAVRIKSSSYFINVLP